MIINLQPDEVGEALQKINLCGEALAAGLAEQLTRIVEIGAPLNAVLWSDPRVGTGGGELLAKLGSFVGLLATHFPGKMNPVLSSAGQNLTVNPDGTVTYTPPALGPETPEIL